MAKRRLLPRRPKSARDQAIDKALLDAASQVGAHGGRSIAIRLDSKDDRSIASRPKVAKAKPETTTANPQSAIAVALANAGLAPKTQLAVPKPAKPAAPPVKSAVAPSPVKQPTPKPLQPKAKAKPKKTKPAKDAQKPKPPKQTSLEKRKTAEEAFEAQRRRDRKAAIEEGRSERMLDRMKEAARTIANIGQASPDELLDLWRANITRIDNPQSDFRALAKDYIEAIESEWTRRSIIARLDPDYFKWPSTRAVSGNGTFASLDHAEGILGYLGYHVGKTGDHSSARRQALLARVFEGALPPINGPRYMEEWDRSGSAIRLEKMANSIASAVQSAKRRRDADYSAAIEHWEEDLKFLHRAYYIGRFGFDWPGGTPLVKT